jgi:hypothetical protein
VVWAVLLMFPAPSWLLVTTRVVTACQGCSRADQTLELGDPGERLPMIRARRGA